MKYTCVTAGEKLAYFVESHVLKSIPWDALETSLAVTGRGESLCEFFREITVINLTCRIVTAGLSLLKESVIRPARSPSDASFEKEFRDFIRDRLYIRPPLSDGLFRNATLAVRAALCGVTPRERRAFKNWAQRQHPYCYMCGVRLDFDGQQGHQQFSLEHLWPQRYGGDSIEDNWLPACSSCNSSKKRDFATWAMPGIQSLVLGFTPSDRELTMVDGTHRFAMHYLAAKKTAIQNNVSLKRAFLILTPWRDLRLTDQGDIGDFFNLVNHRSDLAIT